jgi:hypothetical protein
MTYLELKNRIAGILHRSDLATQLPLFIEDARERINRRFGLTLVPLTQDTETNAVLTDFPLLYVYAACQSGFEYLNNGDNAVYMADSWQRECAGQNITNPYTAADNYTEAPYIKTPAEQESSQ